MQGNNEAGVGARPELKAEPQPVAWMIVVDDEPTITTNDIIAQRWDYAGVEHDKLYSHATVEALRSELAALRAVVSKSADALGNGAFIDARCSIEFMEGLPREISLHVEALRSERDALREALKSVLWGHDSPLTDILFGEMPDSKTMNFTMPLGRYRAARAALASTGDRT